VGQPGDQGRAVRGTGDRPPRRPACPACDPLRNRTPWPRWPCSGSAGRTSSTRSPPAFWPQLHTLLDGGGGPSEYPRPSCSPASGGRSFSHRRATIEGVSPSSDGAADRRDFLASCLRTFTAIRGMPAPGRRGGQRVGPRRRAWRGWRWPATIVLAAEQRPRSGLPEASVGAGARASGSCGAPAPSSAGQAAQAHGPGGRSGSAAQRAYPARPGCSRSCPPPENWLPAAAEARPADRRAGAARGRGSAKRHGQPAAWTAGRDRLRHRGPSPCCTPPRTRAEGIQAFRRAPRSRASKGR